MTALEVLNELKDHGYRLVLRPGGLRLEGGSEPSPEILDLIRAHRDELLSILEAHTTACQAAEASLVAGRVTEVSEASLKMLDPAFRARVLASEADFARRRGNWPPVKRRRAA